MFGFLKKIFDPNKTAIAKVLPIVEQIMANEQRVQKMSLEQMQAKVQTMRTGLKPLLSKIKPEEQIPLKVGNNALKESALEKEIHAKLQEFVPELFAILRELNHRKFNKKHFKVQLVASVIQAQGNKLTELKTGEGKTQVFHLPAALYGLTGRGSHVITVNDYLARRDGEYAGHAIADLGISVGIITPQVSYKFVRDDELAKAKGEEAVAERKKINIANLTDMKGTNLVECSKREAYAQDVVYATNNELGFDYLRDNMVYDVSERVQRELYFCIIDEADSILIDEARTPLIISAPAEASNELYERFAKIVKQLNKDEDYNVDEKAHSVTLTDKGIKRVEQILSVNNIWENYQLAHHLDNALKAQALFKLDDEYIVKNGEILIVDEFTGRVLPGRRYSEGLHQAIEAKEGVEIKRESKTLATITFQNFFKLYKVVSGGSGTIMTEAEEFFKIYNLDSYVIPTNMNMIRTDKHDKIYKNKQAKFTAVIEEIRELHSKGQPILIGTTTIEDSELISALLDKTGIEHEVLNAKFHEREAQIVAKAGQKHAVTVATNMAGRGTDIPLAKGVQELGGLAIVGTERHEARRIDNQLRGRAGRQGDPGVSQFFVALEDEIMRIQGGEILQRFLERTNLPDDMPIQHPLISRSIEQAQKRMEGYHFDIRKQVVDYDNIMNQQREIYYSRRLRILKLTADAAAREKNTEKSSALMEIQQSIQDLVSAKVANIVGIHFLSERSDAIDLDKMIQDFLDLAEDTLLIKFTKTSYPKDAKNIKHTSDLITFLKAQLTNKQPQEVITFLDTIAQATLKQKFSEFGDNLTLIYKLIALQAMDQLWTEHLDAMTDLREGIGLRGYAQRDPLTEYKNEAFDLFEKFFDAINDQISRRILKINRVEPTGQSLNLKTNQQAVEDVLTGSREITSGQLKPAGAKIALPSKPQTVINKFAKVGRNDPCPCGSGLKYKKCGLVNSAQHQARMNNTTTQTGG